MSKAYAPGLESSYIWSLTSQLGLGDSSDFRDQTTDYLTAFKTTDGELLVDKLGPFSKDDDPIKNVTEEFTSSFGDIYWPSYAKDSKFRWSTDKDRIKDLVSTIFVEKFRLYKQNENKDLNVDSKGATPQPPLNNSSLEGHGTVQANNDDAERIANQSFLANEANKAEETDGSTAKDEKPPLNEQEDGSIHLLTSRSRGSARASASARTSEPAANNIKESPLPSPVDKEEDDLNKPHKFPSEPAYRQGILDALDRAKAKGENLIGAIQFVRTTLNDTVIRDAVSSAASTRKIGTVRLTQINERTMAWVFEKLDGSCLWVKPYKGKVINGVVRYSGWTGDDNVFTDYPVTYGIIPKDPQTPKQLIESPTSFKNRVTPRLSSGNTSSKMVNLKIGRRNTENKFETQTALQDHEFPAFIHGESWTMERAKAAIKSGHVQDPPCNYCVEAGYQCMMADRGRTCAFCIAANRSATNCEASRQAPGVESMDYEPSVAGQQPGSPNTQPILTHSGRVSKRPMRDNYVDRSENESDSALSSISAEEPVRGPHHKLRRKSSAVRSTPSLKRPRPASLDYEPASATSAVVGSGTPLTGGPGGSSIKSRDGSEVWFYFTPQTSDNQDGRSKVVRARELGSMHAFFDMALKAWKTFGGSVEAGFSGVDVSWPERRMIVEWRDERDWERMMTMLGRAQGDVHGEVEVSIKYRLMG